MHTLLLIVNQVVGDVVCVVNGTSRVKKKKEYGTTEKYRTLHYNAYTIANHLKCGQ